VTGHPQSHIAGANIIVVGSANTPNAVNEIFLYNYTTKTYDLVGAPTLPQTNGSMVVALSKAAAQQYIDANGAVIVWARALLPQRALGVSNPGFTFKVDQIQVQYGYTAGS
jgi:hypothetical protein